MKKYIFGIAALLAIVTPVAYAQSNEARVNVDAKAEFKIERKELWGDWKRMASSSRDEIKMRRDDIMNHIKDRRMEIKARIASSTKEIKARFDEGKKDRIKERLANVEGKFSAAINRLESFDAKVEVAIERFQEKDINTENAEELLKAAREELKESKELVAAFDTKIKALVDKDEVSRVELKEEAELVIESIKATHKAYVEVIVELRASDNK